MLQIELKNVARISSSLIEVCGITVIAGPNGAGKSTISRAAMTLCSVSSRLSGLVQAERLTSIFSALRKSVGKYGGEIFPLTHFPDEVRGFVGTWLSFEWWENQGEVLEWFFDNGSGKGNFIVYPDRFMESQKFVEALKDVKPAIQEILGRDAVTYEKYVCEKAFRKAFGGQLRPLGIEKENETAITIKDGNGEISVKFNDEGMEEQKDMGRKVVTSVVYVEPIHYVDFVGNNNAPVSDRYTAGGHCICNAISRPVPKSLSLEDDEEIKETREILKEIAGVIHGRLVDDDDETVRFQERVRDKDYMIDLKNMASGMKTMAAIVRAVENRSIRRGSLLIVDEPESNLHPDWQVKFAQFLVLLQKKLGILVLLNTHSPYFLRAVSVYAGREKAESRFYNLVPDSEEESTEEKIDNAPKSFHEENVTGNLENVYRAMAKAFDDLI